jgi:RNA polymerase sigma-70 factor (ECF subfamily)
MPRESLADRWDLERFREYLRLLARLHLAPQIQHKVDPSDIAQETMIKAHTSIGRFRGNSDRELAAWLRRILANTLADAIRKVHRQKRNADLERSLHVAVEESSSRVEAWLAADQSSPSERVSHKERLARLAEAVGSLPESQRIAVELHHLKGCSLSEVAAQMGRSTASVAGLIRRGLVTLRERLSAVG